MALTDRLLNRIGYYKNPPKDINKEKGKYKTITAGGGFGGGISVSNRNANTLKEYENYYYGDGIVFAAINTISYDTTMTGYQISTDKANVKQIIQQTLDVINFDVVLLDAITHSFIYGDAFIEIVYSGKNNIVNLKLVDPSTMHIDVDKYGIVKSYHQEIQGKKLPNLKPEQIIHLRMFPKASSPYGISLIEPNKQNIDRNAGVNNAIYNAILRHTAKYLVKVGTPEDLPPPEVFTDIKKELEDIESKNEIITTGLVDITTIDERGVQGVEAYLKAFITQLITGLIIPGEALGLGEGSTEATAHVKQIMYERKIRSFQLRIAKQIEKELINQILISNGMEPYIAHIKFNSVTTADEEGYAKWYGNLLRGFKNCKLPFSYNEIRQSFHLPPINETWADELIDIRDTSPDSPSGNGKDSKDDEEKEEEEDEQNSEKEEDTT